MKVPPRKLLLTVGLSLLAAGVVLFLAFAPAPVEGFYSPFSSAGCMGDQYMQFRKGRVVRYVECGNDAHLMACYDKDASGTVMISLRNSKTGKLEPAARAEPHWLGTRFHWLQSGESEWKWKQLSTRQRRDYVAASSPQEVIFEAGGMRTVWYDPDFNVVRTSFKEYRRPPAKAPSPSAGP